MVVKIVSPKVIRIPIDNPHLQGEESLFAQGGWLSLFNDWGDSPSLPSFGGVFIPRTLPFIYLLIIIIIPISAELSEQEGLSVSLMGAQERQGPGTEGLRVKAPPWDCVPGGGGPPC